MAFQKKIEPKQIQLIHIAQAQLCLSDDNYRSIIAAQTKGQKHSSKDLTYVEADTVINYFVKTLGFKIRSNRRRGTSPFSRVPFRVKGGSRGILPSNVFVLPSRDQLDMIEALREKITWKFEDGFARWLKKYIKIDRVKTADQASRTIEGLKGLLAHDTSRARSLNAPEGLNIA